MPTGAASSESDQLVFRLGDETVGDLVPSGRRPAVEPATGTDEHPPQTDPALKAETDTHRSANIDAFGGAQTATQHQAADSWRCSGTSGRLADHAPQTDPAAEGIGQRSAKRGSSASRRRAPSEPGPALNRIGEGSVFRPPKRQKQAKDSDTEEMHAVRRQTSSALRPVDEEVDESGMNPMFLALTMMALVGGAALLIWFMP